VYVHAWEGSPETLRVQQTLVPNVFDSLSEKDPEIVVLLNLGVVIIPSQILASSICTKVNLGQITNTRSW
jgi:hypothetical protein